MLLWTGWGINKLSECNKNVYLYEKTEGKAENMGGFYRTIYKDEIKRNKRLFLRREHYDNDNSTNVKYDKKDFMKENTGK